MTLEQPHCSAGVGDPASASPEAAEEGWGGGGIESRNPRVHQGMTSFFFKKNKNNLHHPESSMCSSLQDDHVNKMSLNAMKEQEEGLEKETEIQRLKAQRDRLVKKQRQLQQEGQRHNLYGNFLEEVVKMTKVLQVGKPHLHLARALTLYSWRLCVGAVYQNVVNISPPKH